MTKVGPIRISQSPVSFSEYTARRNPNHGQLVTKHFWGKLQNSPAPKDMLDPNFDGMYVDEIVTYGKGLLVETHAIKDPESPTDEKPHSPEETEGYLITVKHDYDPPAKATIFSNDRNLAVEIHTDTVNEWETSPCHAGELISWLVCQSKYARQGSTFRFKSLVEERK